MTNASAEWERFVSHCGSVRFLLFLLVKFCWLPTSCFEFESKMGSVKCMSLTLLLAIYLFVGGCYLCVLLV